MKNYILTFVLAVLVVVASVSLRRAISVNGVDSNSAATIAAIGPGPMPLPPKASAIGPGPMPLPPKTSAIGPGPMPLPPKTSAIGPGPMPLPPKAQ
jgi:hypothetical protein